MKIVQVKGMKGVLFYNKGVYRTVLGENGHVYDVYTNGVVKDVTRSTKRYVLRHPPECVVTSTDYSCLFNTTPMDVIQVAWIKMLTIDNNGERIIGFGDDGKIYEIRRVKANPDTRFTTHGILFPDDEYDIFFAWVSSVFLNWLKEQQAEEVIA